MRFAYLFGSMARGAGRPGSDVDVGVYASPEPSALQLADLVGALCRACGRDDVQVVVLNRRGPGFLKNVIQDGVLLVERDREERVIWQAQAMSEWYDFAPTFALWRESFWDARRKELHGGFGPGR